MQPTAQGVPSFLQFPECAFLLRQGRVYDGGVRGAGNVPSAGLRCVCHLCSSSRRIPPHRVRPLASPRLASTRGLSGQVGCSLPEPLSMSGGAMYLYGWVLAPEEQGGTG